MRRKTYEQALETYIRSHQPITRTEREEEEIRFANAWDDAARVAAFGRELHRHGFSFRDPGFVYAEIQERFQEGYAADPEGFTQHLEDAEVYAVLNTEFKPTTFRADRAA